MEAILKEDESQSALVPDPTIPGPASRHYHALDGLRGVAVLMVLLFHVFLVLRWEGSWTPYMADVFRWGWVGVDIFFVLSGFLITGILLDSRGGHHYFKYFYARRLLRIVPVYYLLLGIIFGVLPFFLSFDTEGLQIIKHNQGWLWLHATNWGYIWRKKAFTASEWLDLNHLWSLAVEEQFYLVWPAVVYFLNRKWLKVACYACVVGSVSIRAILWHMHMRNGALYFPTFCRLDGLAMGALVAIWLREFGGVGPMINIAKLAAVLSLVGLVIVSFWRHGFEFTDSGNVVYGVLLVGSLAAAVIVLIAEPARSGLLGKSLSVRPLRTVGKYSYGLYLFHNVILAPLAIWLPPVTVVKWAGNEVAGNFLFVGLFLLISWCAALISWNLYEKHWLKLKKYFDYAT